MMEEGVEAREALHKADGEELHFRFIGTAKSRQFVVNEQFDITEGLGKEPLRPEELDFMIGKVLRIILQHIGETPNPALH